jgi:putative hydroxymethylpyrimidine transport system substrate-binding protein
VFAKNHPALDNKLNHETWMMSVKYFDPQPAQFSKQRYLKYAAFLQKEGLIKQMPALSSWAQVL